MKEYYLRLTEEDFEAQGNNTFLSCIVDLYDTESAESEVATPSYRNYSVRRSTYGIDALGDDTWVGMELQDDLSATPASTDIGKIWYNRFVDESGRIDLTEWIVDYVNPPGTGDVDYVLSVYHTEDTSYSFPDEWASQLDISSNVGIRITKSYRYARFKLEFRTTQDANDALFEFLVKVKIAQPLQAPFYKESQKVLDWFPEWMDLRDIENRDHATPELATPISVGAQVINATVGEWLTDLRDQNNWIALQLFLNTASIYQMDWIWKIEDVPAQVIRVEGDGVELARVATFSDFWATNITDDVFFWVRSTRTIYTRKQYDSVSINYETTPLAQDPYHVWNYFDEFGLVMDLPRLLLEGNLSYRSRLLDVYRNRPGVGRDAFKLALRRELNLWDAFGAIPTEMATPDSDYLGATPSVYGLEDIEELPDFFDPDGMATAKFERLIEELSTMYPTTWGYLRFNQALWDPGGTDHEGYHVVPYRFDATPVDDFQAGVGDGNDLYLYRPDVITGPREFQAKLKIKGRQKTTRTEYREITGAVLVNGRADRTVYDNPETTEWFTVRVITDGATPVTYYHSFQLSSTSDADVATSGNPTEESYTTYDFLDTTGLPFAGHTWVDASDVSHVIPPDVDLATGVVNTPLFTSSDIAYLRLYAGRWDPTTDTFVDAPTSATYNAWWAQDSGSIMDYPDVYLNEPTNTATTVVMSSTQVSSSTETWESEPVRYAFVLNGTLPDQGVLDYTLTLPTISWDPHVSNPSKEYVVRIEPLTFEDVGAKFLDETGTYVELDSTYIYIDGSNTWTSGEEVFPYASTTEVTFSSGSGGLYPVTSPVWGMFEAEQATAFEGVVDENGPWRFGGSQPAGNTNYHLTTLELDRDDFGLAHTDDYIVTWIGVSITQGSGVTIWLDTNVVNPAVDDGTSIEYPEGAIEETEDGGVYSFSPILVKARLEPGPSAEWFPQINSGWYYQQDYAYDNIEQPFREHYLYARMHEEVITENPVTLQYTSRQGAPIIVHTNDSTPTEYRQIAFWDDATPWDAATPSLGLIAKQVVSGSGTINLYLGFEDIYNVSVVDLTDGVVVPCDSETSTNVLATSVTTDKDHEYEVTYTLRNSFIADNEWVEDGEQHTRLTFDSDPTQELVVYYETSRFDPATPVDLPLHPFHTIHNEGYVFISDNTYEFDAGQLKLRLSPSSVVANGSDFLLFSLLCLDTYGNPLSNQEFTLTPTWGTIEPSSITTNDDGFATAILTSDVSSVNHEESIAVSGVTVVVNGTIKFNIVSLRPETYKITSIVGADQIPADGVSSQWVVGRVQNEEFQPIPQAEIFWRKGRYMTEVFDLSYSNSLTDPGQNGTTGKVIADDVGFFEIGPFVAATPNSPGFWFVATESEGTYPASTPAWDMVGDTVGWLEYHPGQYGEDTADGVPKPSVQMEESETLHPWFYAEDTFAFPVTLDEENIYAAATPTIPFNAPPDWWGIRKYIQYQLGLLGAAHNTIDMTDLGNAYPDYKEY